MSETNLYTNVVYKECSELEVASRYRLFELRNGAPFYTLSGPPSHALHHKVPYNIPYEVLVYSCIFFIRIGTISIHIGVFLVRKKVPMRPCST